MSARRSKWIFYVFVPLLLALYASYPPGATVLERVRVEKKVADTAEEADAHGVAVGERYVANEESMAKRWLPLALGERDVQTEFVEQREDGTIVEETTTTLRGRIKLGLDLAGGTQLLYKLEPREGEKTTGVAQSTLDILKQRIDPTNVKEYRIQVQDKDRILIQVPAATTGEVERLKNRLERMGKLEFRIAVPQPGAGVQAKFAQLYGQAQSGTVPEGYVKMHVNGDTAERYYLVKKGEPEITGRYLSSVSATIDQYGLPAVGFQFNAIGARKFGQITENNRDWALAIVLDGVLKSAPVIEERITGRGIIRGKFTQQEINDIVNVLRAGSLPMDIQLLQESTVGPQLGRDSIRRGLTALVAAGLLVLVFIGFYYIGCGWVADGALVLNLVFLVGVLSLLGAALTLPGMAGVLLTIGMAVDANVLIFERIREESAAGKGVRLALRNGYERAFTTIVDANVTTLLTAVILYLVGTGPVRGFAVTLSFGILLSMFTALAVTRLAFETLIDSEKMTQFRMLSYVGQPSIAFSRIRRPAYLGSLLVVVVGTAAFGMRASKLYDIDFTGGTLVQLSLTEPTGIPEVRERLAQAGFERAEVQGIRTAAATDGGLTDFGVRVKGSGAAEVESVLIPGLRSKLESAGLMTAEDSLGMARDGRGLLLDVAGPVNEMAVRRALAEGGDPYKIEQIGAIVATGKEDVASTFTVRLHSVSSLADQRDLWAQALKALSWPGIQMTDYTIVKSTPDAEGGALNLVLDKPIGQALLMTELSRRQFPDLTVEQAEGDSAEFVLKGDAAELVRFQKELPAGSNLRGVPQAEIDGLTVTAALTGEFSEQDVRAFFDKQGLSDVRVVPDELEANSFRLDLSYAPIRDKLTAAFADLAGRSGGVEFGVAPGQDEDAENVVYNMTLDDPLVLSTIKHYIDSAGLGTYAEGIILREEVYDPAMLISQLALSLPREKATQIVAAVTESFDEPQPVQKITTIGPTVAQELQGRALLAVVFASVIIVLYVAARFHAFRFGVAAVIALVHDILITAGLVALADWLGWFGDVKINLTTLAAFLTILGYSLNDTIVVFDRIRENMALLGRKRVSAELIDRSINQTLSRTVLTSLTTLMVVVVLYLFGGAALQGLAFTLIVGVLVGTYSSMFIASPILLDWHELLAGVGMFLRIITFPLRLPFKLIGVATGSGR
jgi:protein-export membrane protein SecD/preprotein translocase SecF subunit